MDDIAVFAESPSQREDLGLQVVLRDDDTRPDTSQEMLFADKCPIGLQQGQQELERARSQLDRHALCQQHPLTRQYPESTEFERLFGCEVRVIECVKY
jgi:hypothetical protein